MAKSNRLIRKLAARYRVGDGKSFRLADCDPGDTGGLDLDKQDAKKLLQEGIELLSELQAKLYAQDRWSLLVILQAMDTAGKDGTIRHVFSGLNPQGCEVSSFKAPSQEELDHDFLWRVARELPERGRIGIFNRSHYEEVLVVRVHPEFLAAQHLPPRVVTKRIWQERYEDINAFERHLVRNGTVVLKFFLNISKEEQKKRFLARIENPEKNWKFSMADVEERRRWPDYMRAYEDMIRATSTEWSPWHVVPADHKWLTRLAVSDTVIAALEDLDLAFPEVDPAERRRLQKVRVALEKEKA